MIKTKIPKSVLEILDKFIQINFRKYRYNSLADQLGLKTDTLIQRISRNKDYFDVDDSARPSRISIKKGIPEVYFYRDKNRCHACQKTVDPEKLSIKFRNPSRYEKNEWKNVISVCNDCKDKEILKRVKKTKPLGTTEYKEIIIMRSHQRNPETDKYENFYEFDELNGDGPFPLVDDENNIASFTVADVLNFYSADGWEVIHVERILDEEFAAEEYQVFFKRNRNENVKYEETK